MSLFSSFYFYLVVGLFFLMGFRVVRPIQRGLVERFGKYVRTSEQGLRWIIPFVERMRKVNITEIRLDIAKQSVITKDNLNLEIDAVVYFKVHDVSKAIYNVDDYAQSIPSLAQTTLRAIVGEMPFTEVNANRASINNKIEKELDSQTQAWGIDILRVELQDVSPSNDVQNAMDKVVTAEREKEATITQAAALKEAAKEEAEAIVIAARAQKESAIERATGEAEAIALVNNAVEKTFQLRAQKYRELEVTENALSDNAKIIITEKGISPSVILNTEGSDVIPVERKV
ncbi:MAG: SPFH/Band 7/PHB domain protein [bacterium]|nr:SPFH/Band 7/PHB domain protein [bacterium]